jgi:hypothetical protein
LPSTVDRPVVEDGLQRPELREDRVVRWAALFDDLEAQAEQLEQDERAAELAERVRAEVGALRLLDRARGAASAPIRVQVRGGGWLAGVLRRAAAEWWLVDQDGGREVVVVVAAVLVVRGFGRRSAVPGSEGVVESRLGLRHVLRGIARDRSAVHVDLVDGSGVDGTVDRVGADFIELARHPPGEARRPRDVLDTDVLPIAALAAVRRSV